MTFHFSPRTNRAHEIAWSQWGTAAFERARSEEKPVLLGISAVWCHWCHVMDETTYSDPAVIAAINEHFVPIRVDNDRRPDINARYNQGGWPTTAFLSPDGVLLSGSTYVPAAQMLRALDEIARFYREHKHDIAARTADLAKASRAYPAAESSDLDAAIPENVLAELDRRYDEEYGGFGDAPKFPMVEALAFLVTEYLAKNNQRAYDMASGSLLGMARGGTYDHVEGGFFRYSTTRDWSIPHFEKMTEDHGGLIRALAELYAATRNDAFRSTLLSATGYVRDVLYDPATHRIAGSQDADEAYYELPLDERRALTPPYIDRTSYTNWTAGITGAWLAASYALDDDSLAARACAVLDDLATTLDDGDGLLFHFIEPGGSPQVRGLLVDQAAYLRACLDAHECTGHERFLKRASATANALLRRLGAPDGGFYDRENLSSEGALAIADRPLPENASVADSLLRLASMMGDAGIRASAERTLMLYANTYQGAGIFAAPFARAIRRLIAPEVTVAIVGQVSETADFREAARRLPGALTCVVTLAPDEAELLEGRGLSAAGSPAAYVCAGTICGAPVTDAAQLRASLDQVLASS